jgi:sulfur carrier protein
MLVTINGEPTDLDDVKTVAGLIELLDIEGRIAVEVNREIVPRSQFKQFTINDGDIIEIVHAIGGG